MSWNVTDRVKLNAGLRRSWVQKDFFGTQQLGYDAANVSYGGYTPIPPPVGPVASQLFGFGITNIADRSDKAWMPSAGIQYQVDSDVMAYFSFSQGFKAGGFNGLAPTAPLDQLAFGPEHVNDFELGLKSKWFDDRLLLNLDVFRENYKDLQTSAVFFNPQLNAAFSFVQNAAAARSQGVELETQWAISKDLRIAANVTYLDAYFSRFPNAERTTLQNFCAIPGQYVLPYCSIYPNPVPATANLTGTSLDFSPKWSGSITASYSVLFSGGYKLTNTLSPYFTSRYNQQQAPYLPGTSGYVRLDARLTLAFPNDRLLVDVIGKNLTDRNIVTSYGGDVTTLATKEEIRNVALQFRYRW